MNILGMEIDSNLLDPKQASYLGKYSADAKPPVAELWHEMDRIWDELGLDNARPLAGQPVNDFYSHPVWILNGIFTAHDEESRRHRLAIARQIAELHAGKIADYGGGFGELALTIANACPAASIDIIEPYPSRMGEARIADKKRIGFQRSLQKTYDLIVAQDVLEHVEDPIGLVADVAQHLREGGYAIFANCFYPVIKCHLPSTFHLRHTFRWVVAPLQLLAIGTVKDAEHAFVFGKSRGKSDLRKARSRERVARVFGPAINWAAKNASVLFKRRREQP